MLRCASHYSIFIHANDCICQWSELQSNDNDAHRNIVDCQCPGTAQKLLEGLYGKFFYAFWGNVTTKALAYRDL